MATNVAQDMFSSLKMSFLRILHKSTYNTNSVCNIRTGFGEKKELTYKHPVEGSINRRGSKIFGERCSFRKGGLRWSTVFHAKLLKDANCVLRLVHSKAGGVVFELYAEVSSNGAEILGSEGFM